MSCSQTASSTSSSTRTPSSPSSTACCGPAAACNSPTSSSTRRSQRTRASASTSGRAESPGLSWTESTRASSSGWATSTRGRAPSSTPPRARRSRTPAARRPSTGRWAPSSVRPSRRGAETRAAEHSAAPTPVDWRRTRLARRQRCCGPGVGRHGSRRLPVRHTYVRPLGCRHERRYLRPAVPRRPEGRGPAPSPPCARRGRRRGGPGQGARGPDPADARGGVARRRGRALCLRSLVGRRAVGEARLTPRPGAPRGGPGALTARRQDGDVRHHRRRRGAGRLSARRGAGLMSAPRELPMLPMARGPGPEPAREAPERGPEPGAAAERYRVDGMDCAACAQTVEKVVAALDGVRGARVSFGNATMTVKGDVAPDRVSAAVARAGYRAAPVTHRRPSEPTVPFWRRDARTVSTTVSIALLAVAVAATLASASRLVAEPLYLASMAVGGWPIARAALAALRRRSLDMNVLMTLAAVGAVGIGSYAEGAWVLVLFAVGTTLETYAFDRSRRSVTELMELAPEQARVVADDGSERLMPVEEVSVGARFLVRPGERIPLDGDVVAGASSVDEAPITGESVPVDKAPGSEVFAGTLNAHGALTVRATKAADDSTLARVAALVEQAQGSRAPSERFVDRFARVYTPLFFVAAIAVLVIPVALGGELDTWLYRALALLIVACPCSLVISIPVAVVSAVGRAAREGVLIKGGQALEDLARVRTVAIDKTGTLTDGTPQLGHIAVLDGMPEDDALALVAAVERRSEHPLAQALVAAARDRGLDIAEPDEFEALPGRGVLARVGGRALWAGGPRPGGGGVGGGPEQG